MITVEKETYLLASEAARHLKVSRVTFYTRHKQALGQFKIGRSSRLHYRLSDLDVVLARLNEVQPVLMAS